MQLQASVADWFFSTFGVEIALAWFLFTNGALCDDGRGVALGQYHAKRHDWNINNEYM